MMTVCKNYKPELVYCPFCNAKLSYRHAVSNKMIYFTNGRRIRIRNLGYSCMKCANPTIYFSQTANKFAWKNYTYSVKTICLLAKLKDQHYSRESICDYFDNKNIEMSDRNVDNLYLAFLKIKALDFTKTIPAAYERMIEQFHQIRLSIDVVTAFNTVFIIVYDYFTGEPLALQEFASLKDAKVTDFLSFFLNKTLPITVIASIRKDETFIPLLKSLCPNTTRFIAFTKF